MLEGQQESEAGQVGNQNFQHIDYHAPQQEYTHPDQKHVGQQPHGKNAAAYNDQTGQHTYDTLGRFGQLYHLGRKEIHDNNGKPGCHKRK